jgi:hypothetical protein
VVQLMLYDAVPLWHSMSRWLEDSDCFPLGTFYFGICRSTSSELGYSNSNTTDFRGRRSVLSLDTAQLSRLGAGQLERPHGHGKSRRRIPTRRVIYFPGVRITRESARLVRAALAHRKDVVQYAF